MFSYTEWQNNFIQYLTFELNIWVTITSLGVSLRAKLLQIAWWFYVKSNLNQGYCCFSQPQFLKCGSDCLHPAWRFWNLISSQRVKGYRPWPDLAESGTCVKRFTPWAGEEKVQEFSGEGDPNGTPSPQSCYLLTTHKQPTPTPESLRAQYIKESEKADRD